MGRLFLLTVFTVSLSFAQQPTCEQLEAIIREQVDASRYADAYKTWADRGKCRMTGDAVFANVEKSLLYLIDNASGDDQVTYLKQLGAYYDDAGKDQPGQANQLLVRKAIVLHKHKAATDDELFNLLDRAYRGDKKTFRDAKAMQLYFGLYVNRFKSGKYKMTDADLFGFYDEFSAAVRQQVSASDDAKARSFQSVQNGMRVSMASLATCPKLSQYYGANFKANADNPVWLENATLALSGNRCTIDTLFSKVAERWYAVSPNGTSAYQAAIAAMRRNDRQTAVDRFDAAASFETKPDAKAKIYHTIASSLATSDKPMALTYVKKSLEAQPGYGKAYLLMAQLIQGANGCANSDFETKALSLLAAQTALKAGEVEPALKVTAERQAELYRKKSPSSDEIKAAKMGGKTIQFGCWLNMSVNIPKP